MTTEDQTTNAVFDPADFGIKEDQYWAGPHEVRADGTRYRDVWMVTRTRPGRVHLSMGTRSKTVCPFVLAFTHEKVCEP